MKVASDNGPKQTSSSPSKIPIRKQTEGKEIKILTPKQMLQRLTIALAQVKADNTIEFLINEMHQIIYSL